MVERVTDGGAAVWRGLDQAALDAAYDQNVYAPNRQQLLDRYAINSERVRARIGRPRRHAYGPTANEALDWYPAVAEERAAPAPIQVFIHGGAWRSGTAAQYGFPSEVFVRAGAHFVVPDFDYVQDHGGSLTPLVDQVRRAIAWIWRHAEEFGGDRNRIYLSAHSSGAHLAGCALISDWMGSFQAPANVIKAALLCSGMYDLEPVRLSARSAYVAITDEIEQAYSAMRHLDRISCPLIVAYGTLETPEFQRQSADLAAALAAAGKDVKTVIAEQSNHFEILETLANPYGLLGAAALEQMGLAGRALTAVSRRVCGEQDQEVHYAARSGPQ